MLDGLNLDWGDVSIELLFDHLVLLSEIEEKVFLLAKGPLPTVFDSFLREGLGLVEIERLMSASSIFKCIFCL